jgi:hypothetical protein
MGNSASAIDKNAQDATNFIGEGLARLRDNIPRAGAITEGQKRRGAPKLPPNSVKASAEDYDFVEVRCKGPFQCMRRGGRCLLLYVTQTR